MERIKKVPTVFEKLAEFKAKYSGWSITSKLIAYDVAGSDPWALYKATIYNADDIPMGTGHGFRHMSYSFNGRYMMEAETVAWGKALSCIGIQITEGVASSEEMDEGVSIYDTIKKKLEDGVDVDVDKIQALTPTEKGKLKNYKNVTLKAKKARQEQQIKKKF